MRFIQIIVYLLTMQQMLPGQMAMRGVVQDPQNGKGLESAVVAVLRCRDSVLVRSCISDSLGHFQMNLPEDTCYLISVTGIGFKTLLRKLDFPRDTFQKLEPEMPDRTLTGVTISANRLLVERRPDRLIFNAGNSPFSGGGNAWELLKKAPLVSADENGSVSIRSSQGAAVYINDRKVYLSGEELMSMLKNMNSDEIEKIEIITSPPARYDAEGGAGIINIILKKDKKLGLNGTFNAGYEQTTYAKYSTGLNVNYRSKTWNLFGNYGCRTGKYLSTETLDQEYLLASRQTNYTENGVTKIARYANSYSVGADRFLNRNHTIGILSEGSFTDKAATTLTDGIYSQSGGVRDSSISSSNEVASRTGYVTLNLNYKGNLDSTGKTLNADADYIWYQSPDYSSLNQGRFYDAGNNLLSRMSLFSSHTRQAIQVYSLKLDYSQPLGSASRFDAGAKASSTQTGNTVDFQTLNDKAVLATDTLRSNHFIYREGIIALYANLNSTFKQFDFQIGLRGEHTNGTGTDKSNSPVVQIDYLKLFPSAFVQYNYSNDLQVGLNYNRRINRPGFSALNPFRNYLTPYSYVQGNPFLQPFFTNAFDFSVSFRNKYFADVFCNLIEGQITQVIEQDPRSNSYKFETVNLDGSYNYGLSLATSQNVCKWWNLNGSAMLMYNGSSSHLLGSTFTYQGAVFNLNMGQSFTLSTRFDISADLNGMYSSPGTVQGMFILGQKLDVSAGIRKKFWKKKATLALVVNDIFRGTYVTSQSDYLGQKNFINGNYDMQGFRVSFSYRFGNPTVEKNRKRETGNTEEKNRVREK